ncbi:hypothetical protein [Streptomyces anulatus]|uniref:hypothetical protein n=1 Tax=Streptomyces anulatus TaxID=1892 RepID=UPI0033DC3441
MNADVGEVGAEPVLHVGAGGVVEGPATGAQDIVDGGPLHRGGRLFGLLVAAPVPVLVLLLRPAMGGVAEHLHYSGIAHGSLLDEVALRRGRARPGGWGFRPHGPGGPALLAITRSSLSGLRPHRKPLSVIDGLKFLDTGTWRCGARAVRAEPGV